MKGIADEGVNLTRDIPAVRPDYMIAIDLPVRILIFSLCIRGAVHTCTEDYESDTWRSYLPID